jgi:hypothetical protein
MRRTCFSRRLGLALACLFSPFLLAGCGAEPNPNLSPTSEQDPARFAEAVKVSEEAKLKSLEAERSMFKNLKMPTEK